MNKLLEAAEAVISDMRVRGYVTSEMFFELEQAVAEAKQGSEVVAKVCHDLPNHIGWDPETNVTELSEGTKLYTAPPSVAALIDEIDSIDFHKKDCINKLHDVLDKYRGQK
jgi:hypothetical protein